MKNIRENAIDVLEQSIISGIIVASPNKVANYQRVWARDGVICGLAGLAIGHEKLSEAFEKSLAILAENQGPDGQIPSNVSVSSKGEVESVSYGSLVGRVDATTWFIIGAFHFLAQSPKSQYRKLLMTSIEKGMKVLSAWQYNAAGLIYTPQGGNWADDFITEGYTFYDQLLYFWCQKLCNKFFQSTYDINESKRKIMINFWPDEATLNQAVHSRAQKSLLSEGQTRFFQASFRPSGYLDLFDSFAHSLAFLLQIPNDEQRKEIFLYQSSISKDLSTSLLPAFWPVIDDKSPLWTELTLGTSLEFRNRPYEYHNGGIWPMINSWWGIGLLCLDEKERFTSFKQDLNTLLNQAQKPFAEFFHGQTKKSQGVSPCTWSAAGILLLDHFERHRSGLII